MPAFFYAAKAYDSVPHTLLLHCLLQCGVVGPVVAILVAMYSSASIRVRVGLLPLRCNMGLHKGAHCLCCCMQSS